MQNLNDINVISNLRVYPNPSNNMVYILGSSHIIEVFNTLGKKVYNSANVNSINISDWDSGIYLIKSGNSFAKFIKQ